MIIRSTRSIVTASVCVWLAIGGPLGAQTAQLIGTAEDEARRPYTDYTIRARNVDTGVVVATAPLDGNDATFDLAGLPAGTFILELLDEDEDVVCTEGPFELESDRVVDGIDVACGSPLAWWLLAAAAGAAGATAGVVTADDTPGVLPPDTPASPSQ